MLVIICATPLERMHMYLPVSSAFDFNIFNDGGSEITEYLSVDFVVDTMLTTSLLIFLFHMVDFISNGTDGKLHASKMVSSVPGKYDGKMVNIELAVKIKQ